MVRLFVRHNVDDYETWRKVYDEFDEQRRPMGVTGDAVFQSIDNPNDVTVWHDFETAEAAQSFASSDELRNAMERAIILWPAQVLAPEALPERVAAHATDIPRLGGDFTLEDMEREHIQLVLKRVATLEDAARILGIDSSTLWRKRKKYEEGGDHPRTRPDPAVRRRALRCSFLTCKRRPAVRASFQSRLGCSDPSRFSLPGFRPFQFL